MIFDQEGALNRVGGDEQDLKEILEIFQEDAALRIESLRQAADNRDAVSMGLQAHSFKSASGSIGACELQEIASRLEIESRQGNVEQASSLVALLQGEFEKFKIHIAALKSLQASRTP